MDEVTEKMPERITRWNDLVSFLQGLHPVDMACRGEDANYKGRMLARIDRCLSLRKSEDRIRVERAVCQRFREHAPIYLSAVEHRYLATRWLQLVVMQHYGAPTRLLDWTKSPWVAVYFAVSGGWDSDGYVYGFRRDKLEQKIKGQFGPLLDRDKIVWGPHPTDLRYPDEAWDKAKANDILFDPDKVKGFPNLVATYYSREAHFPRLVAQQGLFTFGSKPGLNHWGYIRRLLEDEDWFVVQIDRKQKPEVLRRLNILGLNGATLFPGADGIGRSLDGYARAWHLGPRPSQF